MSRRVHGATAALAIVVLIVTGGAVHAQAAPVDRAAQIEQQILDRVRAAAVPVTTAANAHDDEPLAQTTIQPGQGAVLDAMDAGIHADFSGHKVAESLSVHAAALDDRAAVSAASETGGVVAAAPIEIRARADDGAEVTRFPASYRLETDPSGIAVAKDVDPGVRLDLAVDTDRLTKAGVDLSSLRVYTRENPGDAWAALPSYFDADSGSVKAESEHLSQFVVIGTPVATTPVPRVVLDPDDDAGWADSPGPRITELPLNVRLADDLAGMLRGRCAADVTITRGSDQRFVSAQTRRAIAESHSPDVMLTLAFATFRGRAWGTARDGGSQLFARGGDGDGLRDSLRAEMPGYTGRPAQVKRATPDFPREEYQGLPGAVAHMETLYMDHNFDRPVIDGGWGSIVNGAFTGVGKYLESKGFSCTNPVMGGWPARPSAAELRRWYALGYRNWQHYGADPVSFSTGNLVESENLFSLSGAGGSATSVSLVYNAQDGRLTRTGSGWNFALGGHAQRFDDHSVMVVRGDGASIMFEPDDTGGYLDPRGEGLHLAEAGGGILRLTSREGETWDFDAADQDGIGELTRHVDGQGRPTTLTYGAPTRDQRFVPLASITDAAGQTVRVDSDRLGRVASFTLPDGRAWSLDYDDAGDLVRLRAPDGGAKTFSYDAAHRIETMTDATGATYLRNAYDADGRVVQQWDAAGNERRFDYGSGETVYTDQEGRAHSYAFDDRSRITRITGPAGDVQAWTYDDDNNVTSFTDPGGRTTAYAYDASGNMTESTDAAGHRTRYTYTPTGQVASRTDPLGRVTSYGYDAHGVLTRTVQPDGSTIASDVDAAGNITRTTLPSGAVYAYEVDSRGNRTAVTDPLGRVTRLGYDDGNRLVSSTDPLGRVSRYAWDARDKVTTVIDPLGRTTRYAYDLNGNLTSATDPAGNVTTYAWDALFRVVSATNALGGVTTYTYDREDGLTSTTDAAGRQTSFVLDALSRVTQVTDPAGQVWKQSYDASGAPVSQTDPRGAVSSQTVDELGRVTATTGPTGVQQHTEYDAAGRVTAQKDADGNTTSYDYDDLDRVTAVTDPTGARTSYRYDADGELVGMIDRLGHPTLYERDAAGQLTATTDASGAVTRAAYDGAGNVTSTTDPNGDATTFGYDDADQLVSTTDAIGRTTAYRYDAVGNVVATTDPNGHTTTATWDAAGNRTSVTDAAGNTTRTAYDRAGQRTSTTDALGRVTSYEYEAHGRLASVTDPLGATTRYAYDARGLLSQVTDARGKTTAYEHDAAGLVTLKTDAVGGRMRFEYDSRGLLGRVITASGAAISYGYDARADRVTQSTPTDVARFEYDAEQRMIAASNAMGTTGWTYTPTGRLASQIDAQGRELSYAYDDAGRLSGLTVPGGQQVSYTHDATGQVSRMTSPWGHADYGYDKAGNLSGIDRSNGVTTRYSYDADDRVTGIVSTTPAPSAPVAAPPVAGPVRTTGLCPVVTEPNAAQLRAANIDTAGCTKPSTYVAHRTVPSDSGALAQGASLSFAYAYDAVGNVESSTRTASAPTAALPSGVAPAGAHGADGASTVLDRIETRYAYDAGDRLTGSSASTGASDTYAYDEVSNRTSWSHSAASSSSGVLDPVLTRDATGASVARPPASLAAGTVTADDRSFTQSQVFDDLNQLVSSDDSAIGTRRYEYDADGHRLSASGGSGGDARYAWDALGQVTGYDTVAGSTRFGYDAVGRRVSTSTQSDRGSTSTSTVWDGLHPVQDTSSAAGVTTLVQDAAGELLLEGRSDGAPVWDLLDRLGTAVAQVGDTRLGSSLNNPAQATRDAGTDRTARITQAAGASDWGLPRYSTSGWNASVGHSGERVDPAAGLDMFYSRGYDAAAGTWLSRDSWSGSMAQPSTLNGYAYVGGNPVTSRDLLGFRALGQYDSRTDSMWIGRFGISSSTVWSDARFSAWAPLGNSALKTSRPGLLGSKLHGRVRKPAVVSPFVRSRVSARHASVAVPIGGPGSIDIPWSRIGEGLRSTPWSALGAGLLTVARLSLGLGTALSVFSLSGDSSGVGLRTNEAAKDTATAATAAQVQPSTLSEPPQCNFVDQIQKRCNPGSSRTDKKVFDESDKDVKIEGEAARYDTDELAQFAEGHSGQGYANGGFRPTFSRIREALEKATPKRLSGPDSGVVYDYLGVRVIINESNPFRSTAFFR